jgi:hypothetical protein
MRPSTTLGLTSAALFATALLLVVIGHKAYLEGCVCIVNSILRASIALGAGVALGAIGSLLPPARSSVDRVLEVIQLITLLLGCFFLVQHAFFVLEAA